MSRMTSMVCLNLLLLFSAVVGAAKMKPDLNKQLADAIAKVRKAKTPAARYKAAQRLGAITYERDCRDVTDQNVALLISLLDIEDDGVRMWVASDLGDIGSRAKAAAPKLLSILAVSECMAWDRSSAATIPIALKKMGVDPPPRNCQR